MVSATGSLVDIVRIIYFVDDKLGGVSSLCYNLLTNSPDENYEQWVIHIDLLESEMARFNLNYPKANNVHFKYSGIENAYSSIKRLHQTLPMDTGALVVNYELEMEMLDHYPVSQTVYQLVHDEYNLGLSKKYEHLVDVFIAHNKHIYQQLLKSLNTKTSAIYFLPHGVKVPTFYRKHDEVQKDSKLKLLFLGRMDVKKGVFDLPVISRLLREKEVLVEWTCIGNGPEKENLQKQWCDEPGVVFLNPATNAEVMEIAAQHDVFVLPTKFEGSPVSLLETMSVGLVPVITNLEGSIREIVNEKIGFRIDMNDYAGFSNAIARLFFDRELLKTMGENCRRKILQEYEVSSTAAEYHRLFKDYAVHYKPKILQKNKIGARLDQPWLPSLVTTTIRKWMMGIRKLRVSVMQTNL